MTRPDRDFKTARRARIVAVAADFLLTRGVRALTMEGLAEAADLSKVTLYSYFPDRDAVIGAAIAAFLDRMEQATLAALARSDDAVTAISAALSAKHGFVQQHVRASAHAADLFAESGRLTGPLIAAADARIEAALAARLAAAGRPDANATAALLFGASLGIAGHVRDPAELATQIGRLVQAVLAMPPLPVD
jgi:AcrR family transcriptional regulator